MFRLLIVLYDLLGNFTWQDIAKFALAEHKEAFPL